MRLTVFAATCAFLLWGAPAFAGSAPDSDGDGISDGIDNCSAAANTAQDDTDGDDCGNFCDADYDGSGIVGLADFAAFGDAFGTPAGSNEEQCHVGTIPGCIVGLDDFAFFGANFGGIPGPSGTTVGTQACPL